MNMQRRSDERSRMLHKEISKKLKSNPSLWDIPKNNLMKWKKGSGKLAPALKEWDHILNTTANVDGKAKPYQVKQFLSIVEKYNLKIEDKE